MSERSIVEMVELLKGGNKTPSADSGVMLAEIASVSPLVLKTSNSSISKNIYINPAYTLEASGGEAKIESLFADAPAPKMLFDFLKVFHKNYLLKKGDTVIVMQAGISFYVAEKVVKVS